MNAVRALACALLLILASPPTDAASRRGTRRVGECGGFVAPDGPGWRDWRELTQQAVRNAWEPPLEARVGHPGLVLLRVHVRSDGSVDDVVVVKAKASEAMVRATTQAIIGASPFAPLPPSSDGTDDGANINYLFNYNTSEAAACRFRDRWSP